MQRVLVDAQKKADARKEELQTRTKQVERLELIISDLQNKVLNRSFTDYTTKPQYTNLILIYPSYESHGGFNYDETCKH